MIGSRYGKPVESVWAAVDSNYLPPRLRIGNCAWLRLGAMRGRGSAQLEHGLTPRRSDVVGEGIVDSETKVVKDGDRRPVLSRDGTDQSRARKRREQIVEDVAGGLRSQLRRVERLRYPASADHRFPRRAEVAHPVHIV